VRPNKWLPARPTWALALCTVFVAAQECRAYAHEGGAAVTLRMTSSSFEHESEIPTKPTCEGANVSPHLAWSGVPPGTKSLALIVDDPDAPDPRAPKITWVHWVVYDLPASVTGLPEGVTNLPAGAQEGRNDWKKTGYRGPCPPIGRHRYFHKLFALDVVLPDLGQPDKAALERAMTGHVLAQATLIGMYAKSGGLSRY
jgi:Raf kinase inhibitor-like YbhB/YbcL family protein